MTQYAAGSLIMLVSGEYSDYSVDGLYRARKPFETLDTLKSFRASWVLPVPDDAAYRDENDGPTREEFSLWLCTQGYVEEIGYGTWHLGSYGALKDDDEDTP